MAKFSKGWAFVGMSVATSLAFAFGCSQSSDLTEGSASDLASSPDLVISQVFGGSGTSSDIKADYIELFNRGTADAPLAGKAIQYSGATGSFASDGPTLIKIVPKNAQLTALKPGQYYLIKLKGDALPLDFDQEAADTNIGANDGKVALVTTDQLLPGCGSTADGGSLCTDGKWVDFVGYGAASQFEGTAAAPGIDNKHADFRKGIVGDNGCVDTGDNKNDFEPGTPGPRNSTTVLAGGCAAAADAGADADAASDAASDADADTGTKPPKKDASAEAEAGPPRPRPDGAAPDNSGDDDNNETTEEVGDQPKPKPAPKAPLRNGSSSCSVTHGPAGTDMSGAMSALFGLALVAASFRARRKT